MSNTNSTNRVVVPEAKEAMDRFKMEVASELGVNLKSEQLTAKDAGKVGGQMTKELVEKGKNNVK